MSGLLNKTWRPVLTLLFALGFFLGAFFYYYRGSYESPSSPTIPFERIPVPSSSFSPFAEVPPIRKGTLLVDGAHNNGFTKEEITVFLSRVTDRGYTIEFIGGEPNIFGEGFRSISVSTRLGLLRDKLRRADSFAVMLPETPYEQAEVDIIEGFVKKGGKLLLIADPTRPSKVNSLAERFGITFRPDYLYSKAQYDINFQNIFIGDFRPDEITRGLRQIVFYTAGSINSSGPGLAFTDANTRSSAAQTSEPFYPLGKGNDDHVLAVHDLTFMIPPQNAILDNNLLISNIANFLTLSDRTFDLADFPHFFKSEVEILLGRASLFQVATNLRNELSLMTVPSEVRGVEDLSKDTVYVGLYEDSPAVVQYLDIAGIQVNGTLRTPFTPDIATDQTALLLLHRTTARNVLVLLGDSEDTLTRLIRELSSGAFRRGLVNDLVGVYGFR